MNINSQIDTRSIIPENWKADKTTFSSDEVINAYQKGVTDGKTINEKIMMDAFTKNLKEAFEVSEDLYNFIGTKFHPHSLYLKPESVSKFDALCVVDMKDYLKEEFLEVYKHSVEIENKIRKETFDICFSFMPTTDKINVERIHTEGYHFTYAPKKTRARTT